MDIISRFIVKILWTSFIVKIYVIIKKIAIFEIIFIFGMRNFVILLDNIINLEIIKGIMISTNNAIKLDFEAQVSQNIGQCSFVEMFEIIHQLLGLLVLLFPNISKTFVFAPCSIFWLFVYFSQILSSIFQYHIKSKENISRFVKKNEKASFMCQPVLVTQAISNHHHGINQSSRNE